MPSFQTIVLVLVLYGASLFTLALKPHDQAFFSEEKIVDRDPSFGFDNRRNLQVQCNPGRNQTSLKSVFLNIKGDPKLMTAREVAIIAGAFVEVYNDLSLYEGCDTTNAFRIAKFSSVDKQTYPDLGTRLFSQKYNFEVICSSCNPSSGMFQYPHLIEIPEDFCPCTAPPIQPFESDFKDKISSLVDSEALINVQDINAVADVVEVDPCLPYQTFKTSNIWIDIDASCGSYGTGQEFQPIANLFAETYNGLNVNNAETCDTYFRRIDTAIINSIDCFEDTAQLQLNVTARCRGCKANEFALPTLLDIPLNSGTDTENEEAMDISASAEFFSRRRLQHSPKKCGFGSESKEFFSQRISRGLVESDCTCSIDPEYRTVNSEEITLGIQSNELGTNVISIREEEKVDCDANLEQFDTIVNITVFSDSEDIASALSREFVLSYNKLASLYCDPFFRNLTSFDIIDTTTTDRRVRQRDRLLATKALKRVIYTGIVVGNCRGCKKGKGIFVKNDAIKRRLSYGSNKMKQGKKYVPRRLQQGNDCFCPVEPIAFTPPTEREFLESFQEDLLQGNLTENITLVAIDEENNSSDARPDVDRDECDSNDDCIFNGIGDICVNNKCLHEGNPRFTLTWEGDDDIDLIVETPSSVNISYKFRKDPESQGYFDSLFSQVGFAPHVESITFPMSGGPRGTYKVYVNPFEEVESSDAWTLEVFTVDSGSEPAHVVQSVGPQKEILFDFMGPNICSIGTDECCTDSDCVNADSFCTGRQCATNGGLTFTLDWVGNDDYSITVVTTEYRKVNSENPKDPDSGGQYESDNNLGATDLSYHTASANFPSKFIGGEYGFYVFLKRQVNAMDPWKVEVREKGNVMETLRGRGSSMNYIYRTASCTKRQDCGRNRICVSSQCIQDGTPRFTLLWEGSTLFDLSVKPPNGLAISRNFVYDSNSGGDFEDDSNDHDSRHVQSVSFGGTKLAVGGAYNVNVTNNGLTTGASWTLNVNVYGVIKKSISKTGNYSFNWNYDFAPFSVFPF